MSGDQDVTEAAPAEGPKEPQLTVNLGGRKYSLGVERAFSLAHQLISRGHLAAATSILEWLDDSLPEDRRIKILQARCEARQGNYAECNQILTEIFLNEDELGDVPDTLHTAIVYRAIDLLPDARDELKALCAKHPELPSLWLLAGDLWVAVGRPDRAVRSWQTAMTHDDQEPRLVATAAKQRIEELAAAEKNKSAKRE